MRLKLIVKALPHYAGFGCNQSTFSVHRINKPAVASGIWIYYEVEARNMFVEKLMDTGILFEELRRDKPWLWREAKLKDPDNNEFILYSHGRQPKKTALENLKRLATLYKLSHINVFEELWLIRYKN